MKSSADGFLYLPVRILSACLAKLPAPAALGLGRFLGVCLFYLSSRRRSAYADIKSAFGDRFSGKIRWQTVKKHYGHLGETALEILRFPSLNQAYVESRVDVSHKDRFDAAVNKNRGVVLLTAHFGNWELLQIVSGILGHPIHVLAQNQKYEKLNEMLNRLRESHGSKAVKKGMGVRELYRALQNHELIGLLGDRDAGKLGGVILPFMGRKTTVPTGAFEMAAKTGASLIPVYIVRKENGRHEIMVGEAIDCGHGEKEPEKLVPQIRQYLAGLEKMIKGYPSQWLWASKRWKYSWTKRIVILSDGKKGHVKQSEAVASLISSIKTQYGRPGMEYPEVKIEVRYLSNFHRRIFPWCSLLMLPWIQGRLEWLRLFFTRETVDELSKTGADFVVSAGSGLIPLNLCLARECRAKSIVLMKPGFPFNFFKYDLAIIPAHDQGKIPEENIRTLVTPSLADEEVLAASAEKLKPALKQAAKIKIGIFIGGDTRDFRMDLVSVERIVSTLEKTAGEMGDYMVTTSRRTPQPISRFLKDKLPTLSGCQLLVIAEEDARPEVAGGMMAIAEILVVTEDSISMISEALSAGKKVVVLTFPDKTLPQKHRRFSKILEQNSAVVLATPQTLEAKLRDLKDWEGLKKVMQSEQIALQKRLEAIL